MKLLDNLRVRPLVTKIYKIIYPTSLIKSKHVGNDEEKDGLGCGRLIHSQSRRVSYSHLIVGTVSRILLRFYNN